MSTTILVSCLLASAIAASPDSETKRYTHCEIAEVRQWDSMEICEQMNMIATTQYPEKVQVEGKLSLLVCVHDWELER